MRKMWFIAVAAGSLTACAMQPARDDNALSKDPAYQSLQRSAKSIQESLAMLAESEQYEKMKLKPHEPRIYAQIPGMEKVVTMPWQGTLEQATSKLASFCDYEVKFMGKPPALPILVQIGNDPATVSDLLRNLGIQAGSRADIVVDATQRIVEVRYGDGGL
ncbi:DotD/TraH family lipoprotein [Burkholderia multivorans]|uniref:DotD/TraH family lipoprotein n=2 Tax=Burkholderia multivorans TaxID=87883 RepID=UPI002870B171|nr:DotD/TraH family lipoprotein [Burkholderia multivorans]